MYLLDANVLIDANRDFYGLDTVPEFWDWLLYQGEIGQIKIPHEIYEELTRGDHPLDSWLKRREHRQLLELQEQVDVDIVQRVIREGYANDLTDNEVESLGRDPFIIAYALIDTANRTVVTTEGNKPRKQRANRRIPNVCESLGVNPCHPFELYKVLGFSTSWSRP